MHDVPNDFKPLLEPLSETEIVFTDHEVGFELDPALLSIVVEIMLEAGTMEVLLDVHVWKVMNQKPDEWRAIFCPDLGQAWLMIADDKAVCIVGWITWRYD